MEMGTVILSIVFVLFSYCAFTAIYFYFLAGAYFVIDDDAKSKCDYSHSFCILVPAHNEEVLLGRLLESLKSVSYPSHMYDTVVIADNCDDQTTAIAKENGIRCLERSVPDLKGKGHALEWAIEKINLDDYDAVLIIDADSMVDPNILKELDLSLTKGSHIIQCHNALGNPEASWLTRIQHISRTIDNTLVHNAKHKLGLSSFLMGNGMCFSTDILSRYPWRSFSLCEDFEYYARLILNDEFIDFNYQAKVYHQESTSFEQAYIQRARWSAGKFELIRSQGLRMLSHGMKNRSIRGMEASFILLLPHPSMHCNISGMVFALSLFLSRTWIILSGILILLEIGYFILGLILAKASLRTVLSIFYAPVYLIWKAIVDILALVGIGEREWKRTARTG